LCHIHFCKAPQTSPLTINFNSAYSLYFIAVDAKHGLKLLKGTYLSLNFVREVAPASLHHWSYTDLFRLLKALTTPTASVYKTSS